MEKYNTLLNELDQVYKSYDVYGLMEQVIKRDDVHEFCKLWNMFAKQTLVDTNMFDFAEQNRFHRKLDEHSTQGYCAMAVRYNAFKIFKWIVENKWGFIDGHWDRVWRVECILTSIVAYDRIDMMKFLIDSGKNVVNIVYQFKSLEMLNIVLQEMELGKFCFKKTLTIYDYLKMYLLLAQTPEVVEYLLSIGIKLTNKTVQYYVDHYKCDNIVHLLNHNYITMRDVYECMTNTSGWRHSDDIFHLLLQLREFGYTHCDDVYDEIYQLVLDLCLQTNYSNVKQFVHYYNLGANIGELSRYKNNEAVLKHILTHNSQIQTREAIIYIYKSFIGYTPILTTTNGYKMVNPDVVYFWQNKKPESIGEPIFAVCDGEYKEVTGDDVCKCYNDSFYNPSKFYFLLYLREFGYITNVDTYNETYQHVLDQLTYDAKECWYKLGGNQGPSHVASYVRFNMNDRLAHAVDLVGYKRVMEWLWSTDKYGKLVKFLRENGYVSNYELIQFRSKKMRDNIQNE